MAQKIFGITIGKKDDLDLTIGEKKKFSIPFFGKKNVEEEIDIADLEIDFVPTLPAVNVVPEAILEKYSNKDITRKFIRAGIIIVSVIVLIFAYTNIGELAHRANIDKLESQGDALRGKIAEVTPYKNYEAAVQEKIVTISGVMTSDVDVQKIVDFVFATAAANSITISNLDINIVSAGGGDCIVTDPFQASSVIGCVTVSGVQPNADAVNSFFGTLATTAGYTDDFINNAQYSEDAANNSFSGSFSFTSELYSNKYNNMLLPLDTLITNGITFEAPVAGAVTEETTTNSNSTKSNTNSSINSSTKNSTPPKATTTTPTTSPTPNPQPSGAADDPNYTPPVELQPDPTNGGQ